MIYGDNPEPDKQASTATLEPPAEGHNVPSSASEEKIPEKTSEPAPQKKADAGAIAAKINDVKNKLEDVKRAAAARGEQAPSVVGQEALDVDATSLHNDKDLGDLEFNVGNVEQSVAGEAGKQMLQGGMQFVAGMGALAAGAASGNLPIGIAGLTGALAAAGLSFKGAGMSLSDTREASRDQDYFGSLDKTMQHETGMDYQRAREAEQAKLVSEGKGRSLKDEQK